MKHRIHNKNERLVADYLEEHNIEYVNIHPVSGTGTTGFHDIPKKVRNMALEQTDVESFREIMCKGVPDFILWDDEEVLFLEAKGTNNLRKNQINWFKNFRDDFKYLIGRVLDEELMIYRLNGLQLNKNNGKLKVEEAEE